jgi:hypothetical protein
MAATVRAMFNAVKGVKAALEAEGLSEADILREIARINTEALTSATP